MRCIYTDLDNPNKCNKGDSSVLAQMYMQLSKSSLAISRYIEQPCWRFHLYTSRVDVLLHILISVTRARLWCYVLPNVRLLRSLCRMFTFQPRQFSCLSL